jgi:predicted outer membrane repeat protein
MLSVSAFSVPLIVYYCIVLYNVPDFDCGTVQGGALRLTGIDPRVEGCTFLGNRAEKRGGAVYSKNPVTVINCVFAGNYAPHCTNVYAAGQCK